MLKQLLTGGSVLALLVATGFSTQAQVPSDVPTSPAQQDSSTAVPGANSTDEVSPINGDTPDSSQTTPESDSLTTSPSTSVSNTASCQSNAVASPTGGGTRLRVQSQKECNQTY